jgi:MFS family permease
MALKKQFSQLKNKFYLQGAFSFANFTLLNGIFLVGFALALGANNFQIGILLAIPLFANLLQLVSAFILEMTGTKKKTTIFSLFIGRMLWIIIILMAFGIIGKTNQIMMLALILLVSSIFIAIGNLSLLSWMKDIVPLRKLARFLGKRNIYASIGGVVVYLVGSFIIDKYRGVKIFGYMFIFALVIGLLGLLYLIKVPEKKQKIKAINPIKLLHRLAMPFKDKNFRHLLYFGLPWAFSINLAAPFFLVFMIDDLSLTFFIISIFLVIDAIARIYGLSIWRHIADKFGSKPLLIVSSTITSIIPLLLIFISKKNYFLIPVIFIISAISYAAVDISVGQIMFKSAPRKYDAYYLSTFTSLTGLMSALGPIIGGFIAFLIKNNSSIVFLDILTPLKYIFLGSFILRTSCIPLISNIHEPKAKDVSDIIERMKTLRFVSFFVNIYDFATYTSKIVLVPQKQFFVLQRKTIIRAKKDLSTIILMFSKISQTLTQIKITPYKEKRITDLTNTLTEEVDKLEYAEQGEIQKTIQNVLSKMESLRYSFFENNLKIIRKQMQSVKNLVEKSKQKLDKTYKKEIE